MYEFMPAAVEFIHKHSNVQKGNILIHCYAGRQRSAICLAAFMVSKYKMTPAEACKMVLDKRPEAFHFGQSLNFDQTLNKYYKTTR
jgi:protein-tyrosine phosphatase